MGNLRCCMAVRDCVCGGICREDDCGIVLEDSIEVEYCICEKTVSRQIGLLAVFFD